MGGQGFSRHRHPDPHISPGGEVFSELEVLGRSHSPSSTPSSWCCCCCHRRHGCYPSYSSPVSEVEVEDGSAGDGGENDGCGGDGGPGEPGEVGGARSSGVDDEMTGNRGSSTVPPREESLVWADGVRPSAAGHIEEDISRRRQRRAYCELLCVYRDGGSGTGRLAFLAVAREAIARQSDSTAVKSDIKAMARDMRCSLFVRRRVNFVIFVVNGLSVLKTINSSDRHYTDMLVKTFNYAFMSFRDNKPVAVVTHGDLLSFHERALVCTHLGELLGIPATAQIFDIPDLDCVMTNLAIVDLLRYCLEQADRNLPVTSAHVPEGRNFHQLVGRRFQDLEVWILILEAVSVFICAFILLAHSLGRLVKWWS